MKNSLLLLSLLFLASNLAYSQNSSQCSMTNFITGGGQNFQITGSESYSFADSLFSQFPQTKRKGYIWKFKKVMIPGFDEPVTFQVHQGISGKFSNSDSDTSTCNRGSYFNTFKGKKYEQSRIAQIKPSEQPALLIYVKRGRTYGLKTKEETELARKYLLSLYQG